MCCCSVSQFAPLIASVRRKKQAESVASKKHLTFHPTTSFRPVKSTTQRKQALLLGLAYNSYKPLALHFRPSDQCLSSSTMLYLFQILIRERRGQDHGIAASHGTTSRILSNAILAANGFKILGRAASTPAVPERSTAATLLGSRLSGRLPVS